jgi:hypothetical protein
MPGCGGRCMSGDPNMFGPGGSPIPGGGGGWAMDWCTMALWACSCAATVPMRSCARRMACWWPLASACETVKQADYSAHQLST